MSKPGQPGQLPAPQLQGWPTRDPSRVRRLELELDADYSLGRDPRCEIAFEDDENPTASRVHAQVKTVAGLVRITDRNSTNHLYLNGRRIDSEGVRAGDEFTVGAWTFKVFYPALGGRATPSEHRPAVTVSLSSPLERLKVALFELYIQHDRDLTVLRRRHIDATVADRIGLSASQVGRYLKQLAELRGVTSTGSQLVQDVCVALFGA